MPVDSILQYGSFGLLAVILFALGHWAKSASDKLLARTDAFLSRLEGAHLTLAETVSQIQRDSAAHYLADSFEQRDIREALIKLMSHVSTEHVETRRLIDQLIMRIEKGLSLTHPEAIEELKRYRELFENK